MTGAEWAVLIPVKPIAHAKSRLHVEGGGGVGDGGASDHADLVRAIVCDTIEAVDATPGVAQVFVVTADREFAMTLRSLFPGVWGTRLRVVREDRARGIDAALAQAARPLGRRTFRASLPADLAALHPAELAAALSEAVRWPRAVVPDADGTGTTLLTAAAGVAWRSAYGPDSFDRHLRLGARALEVSPDSGLRRDLDTRAHLAAAPGLGPRTAAALHRHRAAHV